MTDTSAAVVAIYCRISADKTGRREGVEAQEEWGREYAAQCWPGAVIRVFVDNNMSAARDDRRPGYEALRAAVRADEITHVWTVEQSRLERRKAPWFELAAELIVAGIDTVHTRRDGLVRLDDIGSDVRAITNARYVVELKRKTRDKHEVIAAAGRPNGGNVFGYRHGVDEQGRKSLVVVPAEAEALRWAAEAVVDGWSLTNVGAELRRRGLRGVRGGALAASAIKTILISPTIAGMRTHRGEIVGPGVWEPIISEGTRQVLKTKLTGTRTVIRADGGRHYIGPASLSSKTARKYTLTGGLSVCGVCGAGLVGQIKKDRRGLPRPLLVCSPTHGGRGCIGIMLHPVEAYVADQLFDELDRPEFLDALASDDRAGRRDTLIAELTELDGQRGELAKMWGARQLSTIEWAAARAALDEQESLLRADLAAIPAPSGPVGIEDARGAWPDMLLDERRELLRMFVAAVVISRARPGSRTFDPGRVHIEWAEADRAR